MQMQDLSYALNNQKLPVPVDNRTAQASVEVFSFDNVYTVPEYDRDNGAYCSRELVWGNTEAVPGGVRLNIKEGAELVEFSVEASLDRPVRGVKVRLDDLPLGKLISMIDEDKTVTKYGSLYTYPEGWRSMSVPLMVFKLPGGKFLYIRCCDKQVNIKRFFVKKTGSDTMRLDIVQEQDGTDCRSTYCVPTVQIGVTKELQEIYDEQSEIMKETYGLQEFTECQIAPQWLKKDISLVVILHMQTFTGYRFHTYETAWQDIEKLTKHIDGKHILVYLTGWEGRYYYKYGDYTPDDRMGGAEGLKKCVDKLHEMGCKVMAMYGVNFANKKLPQVAACIADSEVEWISGARYHNGSVDWEGAHHYDFADFATLSIAGKSWGDCLYNQIRENTERFDFDGAFLDIAAAYYNDKNNRFYDGMVAFCDRLRTIKPEFLVSGEGYYDGLSKAMPLFQSGHTDGKMNYHDRVSEKLFTRFSREFAHLCLGDLSRGSTGVHEQGTNTDMITPYRKGVIPTLTLVEDTLEKSMDKVVEVLKTAEKYHEEYNA